MSENKSLMIVPYNEIEKMAGAIAKSKLFGVKTPDEAIALMLIAQAEGMHPAIAARDYHIIEGRPSLKADAMLARFQQAGGTVKWVTLTDVKVVAVFTHAQGGNVEIDWDIERAKAADIYKLTTSNGKPGMWKKYPRQMLRARVISEGIRTIYPACISGFYTPEEVQDFDDDKKPARDVTPEPQTPTTIEKPLEGEIVSPENCPPAPAAKPELIPVPKDFSIPKGWPASTVIGFIQNITEIETKTPGKFRYALTINDLVYYTFSKTIRDDAERAGIEKPLALTFREGKFGKDIAGFMVLEPTKPEPMPNADEIPFDDKGQAIKK